MEKTEIFWSEHFSSNQIDPSISKFQSVTFPAPPFPIDPRNSIVCFSGYSFCCKPERNRNNGTLPHSTDHFEMSSSECPRTQNIYTLSFLPFLSAPLHNRQLSSTFEASFNNVSSTSIHGTADYYSAYRLIVCGPQLRIAVVK